MPVKTKKGSVSHVSTKSARGGSGLKVGKVQMKKVPAKSGLQAGKAVVKKVIVKKVKPAVSMKIEEQMVPVVTVVEKEVHTSHGPVEVHHKYVFIGTCRNCDHMPMSANKLVAVLSIAIAILSGMLISTSLPMNFELPSISMGSITNWITPDSNVQNL